MPPKYPNRNLQQHQLSKSVIHSPSSTLLYSPQAPSQDDTDLNSKLDQLYEKANVNFNAYEDQSLLDANDDDLLL